MYQQLLNWVCMASERHPKIFGLPAHFADLRAEIFCPAWQVNAAIVDNGKQFDCADFRNFCSELGIKLAFTSVNHPESNRVVERANGLIFILVSKALFDMPKGKWAQELVIAVWGHNISCTRTTGFTPFCLLYGKEAITPEELKLGSFRTQIAATTLAHRYIELEAAENARLQATSNLDVYHQETKTWRDKKVLRKNINLGDMVLIRHPDKQGKLQPQWYGPFIVANMVKPGVYMLLLVFINATLVLVVVT
jgi:hypothetical protein